MFVHQGHHFKVKVRGAKKLLCLVHALNCEWLGEDHLYLVCRYIFGLFRL